MDDGHVWYIVSREEAKDIYYNKEKEVYILHADNSETLCTKHFDFTIADAVYAIESNPEIYEVGIDLHEMGTQTIAKFSNIELAKAFFQGYKLADPTSHIFIDTVTSDFLSVIKYPFDEGDIYYTIEDGVMVESVWDDVSEDLYSPHDKYYSSIHEAKEDPRWDRKSISLI